MVSDRYVGQRLRERERVVYKLWHPDVLECKVGVIVIEISPFISFLIINTENLYQMEGMQ